MNTGIFSGLCSGFGGCAGGGLSISLCYKGAGIRHLESSFDYREQLCKNLEICYKHEIKK